MSDETTTVPDDGPHDEKRYSREGCKCELCRKAWATYCLVRREARAAKPMPENIPHGKLSTYGNWKCRCPECKEASRLYRSTYVSPEKRAE